MLSSKHYNEIAQINIEKLSSFLSKVLNKRIERVDLKPLGLGSHSYSYLVNIPEINENIVLKFILGDGGWGHEYISDRLNLLSFQHIYGSNLSNSLNSYGIGIINSDDEIIFFDDVEEVFQVIDCFPKESLLLTHYLSKSFNSSNEKRIYKIIEDSATWLAKLHSTPIKINLSLSKDLYKRHIRNLVGHGEMVLGVLDQFPEPNDNKFVNEKQLVKIEKLFIDWRYRLKYNSSRIKRIHGDFHSNNILVIPNEKLIFLDFSREAYGESADDVSCFIGFIIYISFLEHQSLIEPYLDLIKIFLSNYENSTLDSNLKSIIPPFLAYRLLAKCNPRLYKSLSDEIRKKIIDVTIRLLNEKQFEVNFLQQFQTN